MKAPPILPKNLFALLDKQQHFQFHSANDPVIAADK